ncbi:MAG: molybdopterin synthase sulfur carrier subunit [Anaerolineaceae bacterium]|nr:MAG: molybdopterin synthase sulfur carrier subunit [Anaerolineaceae bacterium]
MTSIKIPTPLRGYTGGNIKVEVSGDTIGAALDDLVAQYPELEPHLFNEGKLRNFINIYMGDEDVRGLDGLDTTIDRSVSLRIIPSIAGGIHTREA